MWLWKGVEKVRTRRGLSSRLSSGQKVADTSLRASLSIRHDCFFCFFYCWSDYFAALGLVGMPKCWKVRLQWRCVCTKTTTSDISSSWRATSPRRKWIYGNRKLLWLLKCLMMSSTAGWRVYVHSILLNVCVCLCALLSDLPTCAYYKLVSSFVSLCLCVHVHTICLGYINAWFKRLKCRVLPTRCV